MIIGRIAVPIIGEKIPPMSFAQIQVEGAVHEVQA
jgi:hypothetical protein